ncbi:hypothetical protein ACOMHN_050068 [Nucella lapillus]
MQARKKQLPALLGMNVLGPCLSKSPAELPPCLQAVAKEARSNASPTWGIAHSTTRHCIPSHSNATIRISNGPHSPFHLLASPLSKPLPGSLLLIPTLVSKDPSARFVRIANLSSEDHFLPTRSPVAVLETVDSVEDKHGPQVTLGVNELLISTEGAEPTSPPSPIPSPQFDGTTSQQQKLQELLGRRSQAFMSDENDLGYTDAVFHRLKTMDDVPVNQPYRRIPPHQFQELQEHIKELLGRGIITESHSPYAAPVVIVRKKDGSIRLCVDYRRLNTKTIGDAFPLPRINESFDALVGSQYFSTLDLASGYHQIAMHPDDQHKTAFTTPIGLFEYTRMPMGLSTAPATFQRLMQTTMSDFLFQFLLVYLDDLLVYSKTFEEHLAHLDRLLAKIIDSGLKLRVEKCQFLRRQVTYLGHTISAEGVSCEDSKVDVVREWPVPKTTTEVRSLLGFASYYRRFIRNFARMAGPLHDLVTDASAHHKKRTADVTRLWDQRHHESFDALKDALTTAPVLGFADFTEPFVLETDASHNGLGAILSQEQDGKRRVVAYASHRLRPTEKNKTNYSSMKLEFLAMKWAIAEKFRDYLLGSRFTVLTDNNPLVHFRTARTPGSTGTEVGCSTGTVQL